jgi:hypothetical protein
MIARKLTPIQAKKINKKLTLKQEMTLDKEEIKEMCGEDAKLIFSFYKKNKKDINEIYKNGRPHPIPSLAYNLLIVEVFYALRAES